MNKFNTDEIITNDAHLIQSFADLNGLKQADARTVIVSADGAHVTDSEGNKLIDGIGGLWCVNVGHGRREIINAITEQLKTLDYYSTFYNFTHPTAAMLSKKIADLAPGNLNRVYFSNSGSVANDTSIRILHHYNNRLGNTKKKKILSRIGAYHGSTHLSMAMTTPAYSDGWDTEENLVHHLKSPYSYREADGLTDDEFLDVLAEDMITNINNIGAENIAAFIAEPLMGAGGIIVAPDGYHKKMREITSQYDIKYIADEVVTAFGRLGHMFSSKDKYKMQPISEPGAKFLHGMTYSGHPAAAAAALANIEILETEKIPEQVQTTGKYFENTLKELSDLDIVGEVRGSHFMMGIEFVQNKQTKQPFSDDENVALRLQQHAQSRGLIARPLGNILILSPTLILTMQDIDKIGSILHESIEAVTKELL